jgi:single-stranded-DNA-specific exonuclease
MVASPMRWLVPTANSDAIARLTRELKLSPLVAGLLVHRGIEEPEAAHGFLHPDLSQLHDPYLMAGMRAAVERLRRAVAAGEKILIYGDYDVDGTMATVVLLTALRSLGANVEAYVPHRLTDGYGMRASVMEQVRAEGVGVVVSVDTGIREHDALARASELGLDCIVTDHHLPDSDLPPACAILDPRRTDCMYPDKNLSGVGVAFKLAQALLGPAVSKRLLESYLKVVAIGTIADVVPLVGENRVIAHFGLAGLGAQPTCAGLEALLKVAAIGGRCITSGDVAFGIAPRLNAAGRMENARDAIDLFTTSEVSKASEIAERLDRLNRERQKVEETILAEIHEQMKQRPETAARASRVFWGVGWHQGVIGIVARRVVEQTHRPSLVIGVRDGVGVGSGRSIEGFHLLDALTQSRDLFDRFGGHAQAAGFTLPAERIGDLERRFESSVCAALTAELLEVTLRVDAEISLPDVDRSLYDDLRGLEPFGSGNPTPVFVTRDLCLVFPPRVLKEKHLKLRVAQGQKSIDALGWGRASLARGLEPGQHVDVAFTLGENVYQGATSLQLLIKDLQVPPRISARRTTETPTSSRTRDAFSSWPGNPE